MSRYDKYTLGTDLRNLTCDVLRLIATRAVIIEIGNALAKARYREASTALIASMDGDPSIEILPLSESLYRRAFDLYRQMADKEWGLTDCFPSR